MEGMWTYPELKYCESVPVCLACPALGKCGPNGGSSSGSGSCTCNGYKEASPVSGKLGVASGGQTAYFVKVKILISPLCFLQACCWVCVFLPHSAPSWILNLKLKAESQSQSGL